MARRRGAQDDPEREERDEPEEGEEALADESTFPEGEEPVDEEGLVIGEEEESDRADEGRPEDEGRGRRRNAA